MDKYELVIDIIERPEKYSSEQLTEILSDSETRDIYNILCKTSSAFSVEMEHDDIETEWKRFSDINSLSRRRSLSWSGNRAASIAVIVGSSLLAAAAGIAITAGLIGDKKERPTVQTVVVPSLISETDDMISEMKDTVIIIKEPVMFENETLEKIMKTVAETYGVSVKFNNREVASLHLYYRFDPSLPIKEIIEQLNTFEQIEIRQEGNILNID